MAHHDLKTWPVEFKALVLGSKTFDIRRESGRFEDGERRFEPGDTLCFHEWIPECPAVLAIGQHAESPVIGGLCPSCGQEPKDPGSPGHYTNCSFGNLTVGFVVRGPSWGVPTGMVVLSLFRNEARFAEAAYVKG